MSPTLSPGPPEWLQRGLIKRFPWWLRSREKPKRTLRLSRRVAPVVSGALPPPVHFAMADNRCRSRGRRQVGRPEPGRLAWDVSCLNGPVSGLPNCSWPDFCAAVDIENPEWAQEFLRCLAGHYRTSSISDLPEACTLLAGAENKDPFVVWIWLLTPDFRGELPGIHMALNPRVADSYYLLNVMRKECKQSQKDWGALAGECMHDRDLYIEMKRQSALSLGRVSFTAQGKFPD